MEINHKHDQHKSDQKVTLEDLLKLKRLEKPSEVFWNRFDRELQEKTWSALVEKVSIGERLQKLWRVALVPLATACLFVMGFFFFEEVGNSLGMSQIPQEDIIAFDDANNAPIVELGGDSIKKLEESGASKNYVKKVFSIEEETSRFRRVLPSHPMHTGSGRGVQFLAAKLNPQQMISKSNLNLVF